MNTLLDIQLHPLLQQADVQGLVFDLDGTLIDSQIDIVGATRDALEIAGYGSIPDEYAFGNLHGTSDGIIRDVMQAMGWVVPKDFADIKAIYYDAYMLRNHANTTLYEGVQDFLRACEGRFSMAICTNKIYRNAMSATDVLGIQSYFPVISGADTWSQSKPSPVPLLETIREMGLRPEQCLYFGDTSVDALCAAQAGVRFVLHEAGYRDAELAQYPFHHAFTDWREWLVDNATNVR